MKAAFLTGIGSFEVRETPTPDPKAGEVLVRIQSVGICGSDVHYYKHGKIGPTKAVFPYVIGHECSGTVEKTGPGVSKIRSGMRVAVEPAIYCYQCRFCREKRFNICPHVQFLGTPPQPGAYSEYLVMPEMNVIEVPDAISFDGAVILEPLTVAFHALSLVDIKEDQDVAIYGCGTIGLSILSAIREKTKGRIFAFDRLDYRLELAKQFGADMVINPERENPMEFIKKETTYGVDRCFEAAGDIRAMRMATEITAPGGTVILGGIPEDDDVSFDAHGSRRKGLNVKMLRRSNGEIEEAIEHYLKHHELLDRLVTHRLHLEEITRGFELTGSYADGVVKVVLHP